MEPAPSAPETCSALFRGSPNQRIIYLHGEPPSDDIPGTVALEPLR